ncbi:MAG: endo-1,4-beta-xylanase [Thermoguttaceae bacterium]
MMPTRCLLYRLLTISAITFAVTAAHAQDVTDESLLAGADARIEEHRKADAAVVVVDRAGRPVSGAVVEVEQTRHAFLFGSNIFKWEGVPNEQHQEAYRRQFAELLNYATIGFYWPSYERIRGQPRHEATERVARWCRQQGITTKGHPLAWNYSDPRWLPDDWRETRRLQMARIDDCVARFVGLIDRWDVVNEVTHFDRESITKQAPKHTAMWKQVGQMEFTRECFEHARAAGPKATLLINDYRTDPPYERVIEQLVDADRRPMYDVIGIQSHMHGGAWTNRKIWETCERFARFGVPLHFTETTILSGHRSWQGPGDGDWSSTPEGEAYQAEHVVRLYTMLYSHPAVEALTWWDFSDLHAWKGAPAGFLRDDMTPKPAYVALKKLIKDKWWTNTTVKTDGEGIAKFRGTLGDYRISVTAGGKQVDVENPTIVRDGKNRWVVTLKYLTP